MIVRRADVTPAEDPEDRAAELGAFETLKLSDAGALTQFGGYLETLQPGSRSSVRHWHERCDEMLHVVAGEVTVLEEDGEHVLLPGDTACWPAGVANAHHAVNRTARPCSFLIIGTRVGPDVCHYPDIGRVLHTEEETWRLVDHEGAVIKSGRL